MTKVDKILTRLAEKPGQIASELDSTSIELSNLAKQGKIVRAGSRQTNKRGRPPVEWALPGSEYKAPVKAEPEVKVEAAPTIPALARVNHELLNEEEARQATYIERVFNDEFGSREAADYRLLGSRYNEITNQAARRNRQKVA
jgi:hypothetical protein